MRFRTFSFDPKNPKATRERVLYTGAVEGGVDGGFGLGDTVVDQVESCTPCGEYLFG